MPTTKVLLEGELKSTLIRATAKVPGWYATRIEDTFRVGMPDMLIGTPNGPICLIEAKRVTHQSFGPTPRQYIELHRFNAPSAFRRGLILGFKNDLYYLHANAEQVILDQCERSDPGEPFHLFLLRFLR